VAMVGFGNFEGLSIFAYSLSFVSIQIP
jgi:hypothetical protein